METVENALILGATGGIGSAVASILAARGTRVTPLSRSANGLDWEKPEEAERLLLAAADRSGPFDLVFDITGALIIGDTKPEKKLAAIDAAAMARQFAVNTTGPALMCKHYGKLLPRKGRAVMATLSARVGSIGDNGLGGWISYRAAKAALNQVIHTASIEIKRHRPDAICVALHPGTVQTGLSAPIVGKDTDGLFTPDTAARKLLGVLAGLDSEKSGGFFDYDARVIPW